MDQNKASAAAAMLTEGWRSGELFAALPETLRPQTLQEGYDFQDVFIRTAGVQRAGWKLGVGSPAAMRQAGISQPLIGQLGQAGLHADHTTLTMPGLGKLTIEMEIAFVLERDIAPMADRQPVSEDIRSTHVTFEVVRSRFIDRRAVGWPSFVADSVGFQALVVSDALPGGIDRALLEQIADSAIVYVNGEEQVRRLHGEAVTDPLSSLSQLYRHAAERGITLKAGEIVTTGAMCAPFDVEGAQQIRGEFLDRSLAFSLR